MLSIDTLQVMERKVLLDFHLDVLHAAWQFVEHRLTAEVTDEVVGHHLCLNSAVGLPICVFLMAELLIGTWEYYQEVPSGYGKVQGIGGFDSSFRYWVKPFTGKSWDIYEQTFREWSDIHYVHVMRCPRWPYIPQLIVFCLRSFLVWTIFTGYDQDKDKDKGLEYDCG